MPNIAYGFPESMQHNKVFFYGSGGDQYFLVPPGITSIHVKMWGAGGGGSNGTVGGAGGYTEATISVTPLEMLLVMVGKGGLSMSANAGGGPLVYGGGGQISAGWGGQGGGRSAIRRNGADIATAGAGGGGGFGSGGAYGGGAGGGVIGQNGQGTGGREGGGATQTAGGAGAMANPAGTKYQGAIPSGNDGGGGGAGGGGWYGGGGGANTDDPDGGGGGGSGWIEFSVGIIGFTIAGVLNVPANSIDIDRGSCGNGGASNSPGIDGLVIIEF